MNSLVTPDILEVMKAVHYRPAVSIILPFEPKLNSHAELTHALKSAYNKVEHELRADYPAELSSVVMQRLRRIINDLEPNTGKKSIAIYVSPVFQKVLYLDIALELRIIVDDSFEIRDLIYSKKQIHKYLLLILTTKNSRMFLGNGNGLMKLAVDFPESVEAYMNDTPQRVANFSDVSARKEVLMVKYLHHVDNALDSVLNAHRLPLFIMGTERILGRFRKLTKHSKAITGEIHGNYDSSTNEELKNVLQPHIMEWRKTIQKNMLTKLDEAISKGKLVAGIKNVWHEAMNNRGRLLVVEKNFVYAATKGAAHDVIHEVTDPGKNFSHIKDAVDEVIEKILENGGDVEFVDEDMLKDHGRVALILFY